MGVCSSRDSTRVVTAKLVLQDGALQEFSYPVKVSQVLQKNHRCFVCNSDDMDFDDALSAINDDEELRLGQLYFALPLSWLNHSLRAEEMAALAVKASSALMKIGAGGEEKWVCEEKYSGQPESFSGGKSRRRVHGGHSSGCGGLRRGRRGISCGSGRGRITAKLSAIPE